MRPEVQKALNIGLIVAVALYLNAYINDKSWETGIRATIERIGGLVLIFVIASSIAYHYYKRKSKKNNKAVKKLLKSS